MKLEIKKIIEQLKISDPARGAYLERHIVFEGDDNMVYTGKREIIDAVLKKSVIVDDNIKSIITKTMDKEEEVEGGPDDEEIKQLMEDHDIDEDTAEKAKELIDEGVDEDDAVELADEM